MSQQETSLRELIAKWRATAAEAEVNAARSREKHDPDEWSEAKSQFIEDCADELEAALAARAEPQAGEWSAVWLDANTVRFTWAPSPASRARPEAQGEKCPECLGDGIAGEPGDGIVSDVTWTTCYFCNGSCPTTPPADRAPGGVGEAEPFAAMLDRLAGDEPSAAVSTMYREAATLVRRLAARAPSAQGEAGFGVSDESLKLLLSRCLKPEEIAADPATQHDRVHELVAWFARFANGDANAKWANAHAFELAYYLATTGGNRHIDLRDVQEKAFKEGLNVSPSERAMLERLGVAKPSAPAAGDGDAAKLPSVIPCRCADATARRLCMDKHRCSVIEAQSAALTHQEPAR